MDVIAVEDLFILPSLSEETIQQLWDGLSICDKCNQPSNRLYAVDMPPYYDYELRICDSCKNSI